MGGRPPYVCPRLEAMAGRGHTEWQQSILAWTLFKTAISGCLPQRKIFTKHPSMYLKQQELPGEPCEEN